MAVLQRIRKTYDSSLEIAIKYYSLLCLLNNISIPERQIQLLAFTATRGNISSGGKKEEFIKIFNSSKGTIGNMIHELSKQKYLVKVDGKIKVNPQMALDFGGNVTIELNMINDTKPKTEGSDDGA